MEKGILEVLVVNARGIQRTHLIGQTAYYVMIKCGSEVRRSKTTPGYHHKAYWNQKFEFEFSLWEWVKLSDLEISIMDEEYFTDEGFVGRAIIPLDGIITEGTNTGYIELHPSPYNVVLEDTSYEGEIKIGLKFTVTKQGHAIAEDQSMQVMGSSHNLYGNFFRFMKMSWWRVFFPYD